MEDGAEESGLGVEIEVGVRWRRALGKVNFRVTGNF